MDQTTFTALPGDQPGTLTFFGSQTADLFTREVHDSLESLLGGLMTRTGPNAGFLSTCQWSREYVANPIH